MSNSTVEHLTELLPQLQRSFTSDGDFAPLPKPGGCDWLLSHNEPGQTYRQFLNYRPNMPGARGGLNIIYLQALGKFPESALKIKTLHKYMEAYFHPMTAKLAPALGVAKNGPVKSRMNGGNLQWNCVDVLNHLQRRVPRDAYILMDVAMTDLYQNQEWNFVFGMARIKNRVGTFSFSRYRKDPTIALKFDRAIRHQKLATFLNDHKMTDEAKWFEKRI